MRLFLLTALTMTAFAANSILNRLAVGQGHIGSVEFALIRLMAGAVALAALLVVRHFARGGTLAPGSTVRRVVGSSALLVYLFGFSWAYGALDAGVGALILFGVVQLTMFAGALILREDVPARRWVGSALAFAGLVWLLAPGAQATVSLPHAASMALAGLGWGLYSLAARGVADPLGASAWNFVLALPLGLAIGLTIRGGSVPSETGFALAVLSGAVTSGLGYALWYAILPRLGATRAAVAQLSAPVIAAFGGLALIGEPVTFRLLVAALLVIAGVATASLSRLPR